MKARRMFALVAGVVCAATAFASGTYTWNSHGSGNWTDPATWGKTAEGDYPKAADDAVAFTADKATVTLDTGTLTDIAKLRITVTGPREATVNGTSGSYLRLNAGPDGFGNSLVTTAKSTLNINVPVYREGRFDLWNRAYMTFGAVITNICADNVNSFFNGGTNIFKRGGGYYQPNGVLYLGNGFDTAASPHWMTVKLEDNAFIKVKALHGNYGASGLQSLHIQQCGEESVVDVENGFVLGYSSYPEQEAVYELQAGRLHVGRTFELSNGMPASYYQTGGSASISNLVFDQSQNSKIDFRLHGGRLDVDQAINIPPNAKIKASFRDCTICCSNSYTIAAEVKMAGTITFEVPAGKTVTIAVTPDMPAGTKFIKLGEGDLKLDCDMQMPELDIQAGSVTFMNEREFSNPDGDYTVRKVNIANGAKMVIDTIATHLSAPFDVDCYVSEDGTEAGQVVITHGRCGLFPHSFATNGVKLAFGRYEGGFCKAFPMKTYYWLHVSHIWTGEGGDCKMNNAANWEDGTAPDVGITTTFLDLSRATNFIMTSTTTIGGFVFNGNHGNRKLRITRSSSSYVWRMATGSYATSSIVGPGREVIFHETEFRRESNTMGIYGGGRITVEGNNAIEHKNAAWGEGVFSPFIAASMDFTFQYCTSSIPTRYFTFFGYGDYSRCRIFFGEGLDMEMGTLNMTPSGFTTTHQYEQTAGKVSFDNIYLSNMAGNDAKAIAATYYLKGGELTVRTKLGLGINVDSTRARHHGENFEITGGKLTAALIEDECNSNYLYFYGGDVYLGEGGIRHTNDPTSRGTKESDGKIYGSYVPNTAPSIQWGGTKIHATADLVIDVDAELVTRNGNAILDTDSHTVTFQNNKLVGSSALTKTGSGTLVLDGTNAFTGKLTVEEGVLRIASNATFGKKMALDLASANSIELPADAEIEVASLVVDGVKQTGSVEIGGGTLTVEPNAGSWIGGAAANWADAANWGEGVVPTDGVVDFGLADEAADTVITVTDSITLKTVTAGFANGRTVTLRASGDGKIVIPNKSTVTIPYGRKLVLEAPLEIGGLIDVYGGGELVLAGDDKSSVNKEFFAHAGSTLTFRSEISTINKLYAVTAKNSSDRLSTIRIEDGANIAFAYFPPYSGNDNSIGGRLEIVGGYYKITNANLSWGGTASRQEVLDVRGGTIYFGSLTTGYLGVQVNLYGGKLYFDNYYGRAVFDPRVEVNVYGEVAFENYVKEHSLANTLGGKGGFTYLGTSKFTLGGDIASLTNITAMTSGTLAINADAAATITPETVVNLGGQATLDLDYEGTVTIKQLYKNGKQMRKGLYGENLAPRRRLAPITGTGKLLVLEGNPRGLVIVIR